jgi:hypothetical protein
MYLTEELLTEWTGLKGRDLSIFYLSYKQHSANGLLHTDLEYIKQDILKFKDTIYNQQRKIVTCGTPLIYAKIKQRQEQEKKTQSNVKTMIQLWESKIKRDM